MRKNTPNNIVQSKVHFRMEHWSQQTGSQIRHYRPFPRMLRTSLVVLNVLLYSAIIDSHFSSALRHSFKISPSQYKFMTSSCTVAHTVYEVFRPILLAFIILKYSMCSSIITKCKISHCRQDGTYV